MLITKKAAFLLKGGIFMDYSMLEMMCEEYLNNSMDFVKYTKTEAEKKFGEKYIKPEIKKIHIREWKWRKCLAVH